MRIKRSTLDSLALALLLAVLLQGGGTKAAFPGVNGKILFHSSRTGDSEIYTMNADGTGQTNLTNNPAADQFAAWSADGTKIAFASNRDDPAFEIYTMNANGTGVMRLTFEAGIDFDPAWSPDGTKIVFESQRDDPFREIYVMDTDGTGVTRLTFNSAFDGRSAWSPDGTKIAFLSFRDGNAEIYTMNADGTGQTNLTNNPANDGFFANWSPDGTKIAFASNRDGNSEIYTMNGDGTGVTRLTSNPATDAAGAWSPDGTKIVFTSLRDGGDAEIYTMNADGSGQTRLTFSPGFDSTPDWQPLTGAPDTVAPVLTVPGTIVTNATSPTGALVSYSVSATDNVDPNPTVTCAPSSGTIFPIGTTTVSCTATDSSGNSTTGTFLVIVKGPADQLANLINLVTSFNLNFGIESSLLVKLENILAEVNSGDFTVACNLLAAFIHEVQGLSGKSGNQLTVAQANLLTLMATTIEGAVGCPP